MSDPVAALIMEAMGRAGPNAVADLPVASILLSGAAETLVATGLWLLVRHRLRGRSAQRSFVRGLERGFAVVHDVLLRDASVPGGWSAVDHLVRLDRAIVCVAVVRCAGRIQATTDGAQWIATSWWRRSYLVDPVALNRVRVRSVAAVAAGAPVVGLVVVAGGARFPDGPPEGCCDPAGLPTALRAIGGCFTGARVPEPAWRAALDAAAKAPGGLRRAQREQRTARSRAGWSVPAAIAIAAGLACLAASWFC